MKLLIGIAAVAVSLSYMPLAFAGSLNKDTALAIVLENNPRLKAALARIEALKENIYRLLLFPTPKQGWRLKISAVKMNAMVLTVRKLHSVLNRK